MSQEFVLSKLKELGGRASQRQLELAIKPFKPDYNQLDLAKYVNRKLQLLRKWGDVSKDEKAKEWVAKM